MSLDRKDSSGHYKPSNCKWSTPLEQNNNTRFNRRNTKLNAVGAERIRDIRRVSGLPHRKIANYFGIDHMTVGNILRNKTWSTT